MLLLLYFLFTSVWYIPVMAHGAKKGVFMKVGVHLLLCISTYLGLCDAANATLIWGDGFESGDFSHWSYVQGQDPSQGGPGPNSVYVTTYNAAGIPAREGSHIAHFERPASAANYPNAKIYKEWSAVGKLDQFRRVEDPIFNNGDVSGVYLAWYYFPSNYTCSSDWVNIFQFKEEGYDKSGKPIQNPSWWLNVGPSGSFGGKTSQCVMFLNNWGNKYVNYHPKTLPVPLGRWFEVRVFLYQGNRIDWFVNSKLFDTSYNSTYPVGRYYPKSNGWVFGVGHYGGVGQIYVDKVQVYKFFAEP